MDPYAEIKFLNYVHRNAPVSEILEILFHGNKIENQEFIEIYLDCLEKTGTGVPSYKRIRRAQRAMNLIRLFEYSIDFEGNRVECGVFRGFSSLLLSRTAHIHNANFVGDGLHLIDSFEGLSQPTAPDAVGVRERANGINEPVYGYEQGYFATPLDHVRKVLAEFPNITIHKGWIPDVFQNLAVDVWCFVHIDVDLYQPTKDCLEYFVPKLAPNGVIVNDDFSSPLLPGGGKAWHEFFHSRGLSYVVLDTGQAVFKNKT